MRHLLFDQRVCYRLKLHHWRQNVSRLSKAPPLGVLQTENPTIFKYYEPFPANVMLDTIAQIREMNAIV